MGVRYWPIAAAQLAPTSVSFGENRRPESEFQRQETTDTVEKLVNLDAEFFR